MSPGSWRDRPPHLQRPRRSPSDSPNWREARPDRPVSFKSPSPPPAVPSPTLNPPVAPPKPLLPTHSKSDLPALVYQVTITLQGIMAIAQKLVRRVNAARRIAHKTQRCRSTVHEVVHRNAPCVSSLEGGTCDRVSCGVTPTILDRVPPVHTSD